MTKETLQAIGRLRRNQPRNPDTLQVCDEYERLWKLCRQLADEKMQQVEIVTKTECPDCEKRRASGRQRINKFRSMRKLRDKAT